MGAQEITCIGERRRAFTWAPSIISEVIMREAQRNTKPEAPAPVRSLPSTRGAMTGWGGSLQMQREMQEVLRRERDRARSAAVSCARR